MSSLDMLEKKLRTEMEKETTISSKRNFFFLRMKKGMPDNLYIRAKRIAIRNRFSTQYLRIIFEIIFAYFSSPLRLYYTFLFCLTFFGISSTIELVDVIVVESLFVFHTLAWIILQIYWFYKITQSSNVFDEGPSFKVFNESGLEKKKPYDRLLSNQLQIGDIVKFSENQMIPNDILLMTSSGRSSSSDVGVVDLSQVRESNTIVRKFPGTKFRPKMTLVQDEDISDYIRSLNFTLEFSMMEDDSTTIEGVINLSKDPKPELVQFSNVIEEGSIVRSEWIVGLVIKKSDISNRVSGLTYKSGMFDRIVFTQLIFISSIIHTATLLLNTVVFNFFDYFSFMPFNIFFRLLLSIPFGIDTAYLLGNIIYQHKTLKVTPKKSKKISMIDEIKAEEMIKTLKIMGTKINVESQHQNVFKDSLLFANPSCMLEFGAVKNFVASKSALLKKSEVLVRTLSTISTHFPIYYQADHEDSPSVNEDMVFDDKAVQQGSKNFIGNKGTASLNNIMTIRHRKSVFNQNKDDVTGQGGDNIIGIPLNSQKASKTPSGNFLKPSSKTELDSEVHNRSSVSESLEASKEFDTLRASKAMRREKGLSKYIAVSPIHMSETKKIDSPEKEAEILEISDWLIAFMDVKLLSRNPDNNRYKSHCSYENAVINFINSFGVSFKKIITGTNAFEVRVQATTSLGNRTFDIIAFDYSQCGVIKLIVQTEELNTAEQSKSDLSKNSIYKKKTYLLVRQDYNIHKTPFSSHPNHISEVSKIIRSNEAKNLSSYIFWKRELDEFHSAVSQMAKVDGNLKNFDSFLEIIGVNCLKSLNLCCIMGFEEKHTLINDFAFLKSFNIRKVFITEDSRRTAKTISQMLGISSVSKDFFQFDFNTQEMAKSVFTDILNRFCAIMKDEYISQDQSSPQVPNQNQVQPIFTNTKSSKKSSIVIKSLKMYSHEKFTFFISSSAFSIICSNHNLFYHFKFLLKFSSAIIAYEFQASQKQLLIEILRQMNPNVTTMVMGNSINDLKMMRAANVCVNVLTSQTSYHEGDVLVGNPNVIFPEIFFIGKNFVISSLSLVETVVYMYFINMIMFFMDQMLTPGKTQGNSFPSNFLITAQNFFTFFCGLAIVLTKQSGLEKRFQFPQTYQEYSIVISRLPFIIGITIVSSSITSIGLYLSVYYLTRAMYKDGVVPTVSMMNSIILLILPFIFTLKFFLKINRMSMFLIMITLTFLSMGGIISWNYFRSTETLAKITFDELRFFFPQPLIAFFFLIALIYIFQITFYYLFERFFCEPILKINYILTERIPKDFFQRFISLWFRSQKLISLPVYLSSIFPKGVVPDQQIVDIVTPNENPEKPFVINTYSLQMNNSELNKQFDMKSAHTLTEFVIALGLFLVYLLVLLILEFRENSNARKILITYVITNSQFIPWIILVYIMAEPKVKNQLNYLLFYMSPFLMNCTYVSIEYASIFAYMSYFFILVKEGGHSLSYVFMLLVALGFYTVIFILKSEKLSIRLGSATFLSILIISVPLLRWKYYQEKLSRLSFIIDTRLQLRSNYNTELLHFLMPRFVLNRISYDINENSISDDAGFVTVLFAEVCDFDSLIGQYKEKIIQLLDRLYRDMDILCEKYGVQKIETVGKTYLAACGIKWVESELSPKLQEIEPTKRMMDLAIHINKIASKYFDMKSQQVKMRIGIHYGKAMMGIIGYHKPQFSLIGDTVNTSSRLCSTGKDGEIMLSEEAYALVKDFHISSNYTCVQKMTAMKGKGDVNVYHFKKMEAKLKNTLLLRIRMLKQQEDKIDPKFLPDFQKLVELESIYGQVNDNFQDKMLSGPNSLLKQIKNVMEVRAITMTQKPEPAKSVVKTTEVKSTMKRTFSEEFEFVEFKPIVAGKFMSLFTLNNTFLDEYYKSYIKRGAQNMIGFLMCIICFSILQVLHLVITERQKYFKGKLICSCYILAHSLVFFILRKWHISWGKTWPQIWFFYGCTAAICATWVLHEEVFELGTEFANAQLACLILCATSLQIFSFINMVFYSIFLLLLTISVHVAVYFILGNNFYFLSSLSSFTFVVAVMTYKKFGFVQSEISYFNNRNIQKQKNTSQNDFINRLIPPHVQELLKNPSARVSETHHRVSILFADICGFTAFSSNRQPKDVVSLLSKLFTDFDKECNQRKLYKLYTIGDCYVTLSFLDKAHRGSDYEEAKAQIEMAFALVKIVKKIRNEINFEELAMRIGVHTGSIIGGVLGTDIVRYDIYGQDVIIANKMESNGDKDKVNVSETTKSLLESNFKTYSFEPNKVVDVKGKMVQSYFVTHANSE